MNSNAGALVQKKYYSPLLGLWQDTRVKLALQVLFLIGMGYLAAFGKRVHPSMGIPGSSALWWLMPMMIGKLTVRRPGAGILMGSTIALSTIPIGLNHTSFYNFGLYGFTGLALDLAAAIPWVNIRNPFGAVFCGIMAHMVKFGFILGAAFMGTAVKHFLIVGVLQAFGLHLAFGAVAGIAGFIPFFIWKKLKKNNTDLPAGL